MQDKNNKGLDPALIDNAWLQMEHQLNLAMPQKKRRAIWWWAGFAGLAILLLNIYLFSKDSGYQPEPAFITNKENIVASKANNQVQNTEQQNNTPSSEALSATAPVAAAIPLQQEYGFAPGVTEVATPLFQSAATNEENESTEKTPNTENNLVPTEISIPNAEGTTVVAANEVLTNKNAPSATQETPVVVALERSASTKLAATQMLPTISDFRFPTSDFKLPVKVTEVKPIHSWHYYLEGQAGASLATTDYSSIAIGGGAQRDFGAKWGMELGLQYQLNQRSFFPRRDQANVSADELVGALGSGYAVERALAFQNLETARLNLYVGGTYQFSPRISFGLAVQGSYFTKAYAIFEDASSLVAEPIGIMNSDLRVDLYDSELSVYDLDTTTNLVSEPYPLNTYRWQWSLNSSARYRFAQHWEAVLQYQHHLTAWPNKEEPFGGLSAMQVGLRYYLR